MEVLSGYSLELILESMQLYSFSTYTPVHLIHSFTVCYQLFMWYHNTSCRSRNAPFVRHSLMVEKHQISGHCFCHFNKQKFSTFVEVCKKQQRSPSVLSSGSERSWQDCTRRIKHSWNCKKLFLTWQWDCKTLSYQSRKKLKPEK